MKVAAIAGLAVLAACAAAPPERLQNPKRKEHTEDVGPLPTPLASALRPPITLPPVPAPVVRNDPSELVRWPLGQATHPALDPAFAIAKVFARPGVSWIDLCARGVQNRRGGGIAEEHRAYLTAWCEVLKRDTQSALARLAPLMSTTQRGIPDAVRHDVANIVVDAGPADVAEELLSKARIDDVAVFDLVAATYAEVGRAGAASYFNNRALASTSRTSTGYCERNARAVLLAPENAREDLIETFRRRGGCNSLADDLACWNDPKACDPARTAASVVHDIYSHWPTVAVDARSWFELGVRAYAAFPNAAGADELATVALGASLRASHCIEQRARDTVSLASALRAHPKHDPALDPELDRIITKTAKLCLP